MIKSAHALRKIGALFIVLAIVITPSLAQTCTEIITPVLEEAKASIGAGNSEDAISSIDEAQSLLSTCGTAEASEAVPQATSDPASTDVMGMELTADSEIAYVVFAHGSLDAGPLDLYTNNSDEPVITDLQFGEVTDLMRVASAQPTFIGRAAGSGPDGEILFTSGSNLAPNTTWIVAVVGLQENLSLLAEPISVVRNDYEGQARVRVINLMPGVTADIRNTGGDSFGTGLGWLGIQDILFEGGTETLQINSAGDAVGEPMEFDFAPDTTTTLLLIGGSGAEYPVQFLPVVVPQDITRVRFVNARADAVDLFHSPSDERIVEGLAAGDSTDWIPLASDAVTFTAYAPGTGPEGTQLVGLSEQLYPGRDLTITITDTDMTVTETALSPQE